MIHMYLYLSIVVITFILILVYSYFRKKQHFTACMLSYSLTPKIIEELVNIYYTNKVLPEMLIPENTFSETELEKHRKSCIKLCMQQLKKSKAWDVLTTIYHEDYLILLIDKEISTRLIRMK